MPQLTIHHQTTYWHSTPAPIGWQVIRLQPRNEPSQQLLSFDLEIKPGSNDLNERRDFFGNTCHVFTVRNIAKQLVITATSRVQRDEPALPLAGLTPPLQSSLAELEAAISTGQFDLHQYRQPTELVPFLPEARELAAQLDPVSTPLIAWIAQLGETISRIFQFQAGATDTQTPLATVLSQRMGVCQDFTHVMLSCLRSHGLAAAYVSGYLLTNPPPGQPRLRGADAMHAWVSVWLPGFGWIDYDPTNQCFAGTNHVVIARGRDYQDVSPTRGLFRGSSHHTLSIGVTVEPAEISG